MSNTAELQERIEKAFGKRLSDLTEEEHEAFGAMMAQALREAASKNESKED